MYISILRPDLKNIISFSPYNRAKIYPKITPPPYSKVDGRSETSQCQKNFKSLKSTEISKI